MRRNAIRDIVLDFGRICSVLALFSASASASQIVFATAPGALNGERPVSVQAIFDISPNSLTVKITNLQDDPVDVTQGLNALAFQPTGKGLTIVQPAIVASASSTIFIGKDGTHGAPDPVTATSWAVKTSGAAGGLPLQLCRLCAPTADQLLLGGWGDNGLYNNGNGSIDGNKGHNPFLYRTATFTISGVNNIAGIGSVIFSFGTSAGQDVPAFFVNNYMETPEPESLALIGGGLLLLCAGAWFSRNRARPE